MENPSITKSPDTVPAPNQEFKGLYSGGIYNKGEMSVKFGTPVKYERYGSQSIPLTTPEGEELILDVKNCMSWGFQNSKYGQTQLPLVLGSDQSEFLSGLESIRVLCVGHLRNAGHEVSDDALKSLYEKDGKDPTLYAKVVENVLVRGEDREEIRVPTKGKGGKCYVHAAVLIESIFVSKTKISLQIKVCEVMILDEVKTVPAKRKPRF